MVELRYPPPTSLSPSLPPSPCVCCSQCLRCVLTISQPEAADHGVYQCVGQAGYDRSTAIVSSSYLNIQCEYYIYCCCLHTWVSNLRYLSCVCVYSSTNNARFYTQMRYVLVGFFLIRGFSINPCVQKLWREKANCK